jgi:surface polysaccharide O-acyltransferase-like enzyme
MKQRNFSLDILRVAAAFGIVWLHVAHGVVTRTVNIQGTDWWAGVFADALCRWCVPVFVIISGALLLPESSGQSLADFYKRRASRLLLPTVFWSIFYTGWKYYFSGPFNYEYFFIVGQPFYHIWFLYMLIGLYAVTPFLRHFVKNIPRELLFWAIVVTLCMGSLNSILKLYEKLGGGSFLSYWPPFVGFFLAGHYIILFRPSFFRRRYISLIVITGAVLLTLTARFLFPSMEQRTWDVVFFNMNPLIIIMSICMFGIFYTPEKTSPSPQKNSRIRAMIAAMSPLTLGIYIIHPLCMELFGWNGINGSLVHPIVGIPVFSMVVFAVSMLCIAVLCKIPVVRLFVK